MRGKTLLMVVLLSICAFFLSFLYGYFLSDAHAERPSVCQGPAVYCASEMICWGCAEWTICCIKFIYTMHWYV
jgi:hypothetical protein